MEANNASEELSSQAIIINRTLSFITSTSLKCVVQLGIPDLIHTYGHPMPLQELARSIPIPPSKVPMLHRLMRFHVQQGVFATPDETAMTYDLTPISRNLIKGRPNNMVPWVDTLGDTMVKPWYAMSDWLKVEGSKTPFGMINEEKTFWDSANETPGLNKWFNESMACRSKQMVTGVLKQYPELFEGVKTLVDVGGGTGTAVRIIAEAFPELRCTVFDLPHVIASLSESKVFDKVSGDMFESIPCTDVILLQSILHDWTDEECVKILKRCKDAIPEKKKGGKVLIMEIILNSQNDVPKITETTLFMDLAMMAIFGGKERDEQEWKSIFDEAGFSHCKIYPTFGVESVIELYP
ncbi:hypothetical protein LUZ60_013313 [Juncus effusus]|nr:hypothetical protein LUZ60_013313 [Juncus effusus]